MQYGLPLALNMFIIRIFTFSDRWLLARLQDFSAAGAYSAAVRIAGIVAMVIVPIRYAWVARMFHMHRAGALAQKLPEIWRQLAGGMAIISLFVILLSHEIFALLIGAGYEQGMRVIPILALAYFLDALILIADAGIYVSGKTAIVPVFTGFAAIANIALNILLIPRYGLMGAAIAALTAYALLLFLGWRMGQFLMPIKIPYARVSICIFGVVAAVVVALAIQSVVFRIVILFALCAGIIIASALDRDIARLFLPKKKLLEN